MKKIIQFILNLFGFKKEIIVKEEKWAEENISEKRSYVEKESILTEIDISYPQIIHAKSKSIDNFEINNENGITKGLLEDYFYDVCLDQITIPLLRDVEILISNGRKIYPDFALIDDNSGVNIAIEIDEPYTIDKNSRMLPIHYQEKDTEKEQMLIKNGWTIIRFAEEQIALEPENCRLFLIDFLISEKDYNGKGVKRWSKDEALEMIANKFRNTYLPKELNQVTLDEGNSKFRYRSFPIKNIKYFIDRNHLKDNLVVTFKNNDLYSAHFPETCKVETQSFLNSFYKTAFGLILQDSNDQLIRNIRSLTSIINFRFNAIGVVNQKWFNIAKSSDLNIILPKSLELFINQYYEQIEIDTFTNEKKIDDDLIRNFLLTLYNNRESFSDLRSLKE